MTGAKRPRPDAANDDRPVNHGHALTPTCVLLPPPSKKRRRTTHHTPSTIPNPFTPPKSGRDLLSPLSDELLLRILSFLPLPHLLAVAPVSHRFYALAADSQLWKALYYARFVLPRAMRIPGFRDGGGAVGSSSASGGGAGHKLHYSGRRTLWADGRRGGVVVRGEGERGERETERAGRAGEKEADGILRAAKEEHQPVNWKRQYKIRYNWARGKCAVEELTLGQETGRKMLVKVVEGVAVTADKGEGLRAWDLKSRNLIAQIGIGDHGSDAAPSCIAVDEAEFERGLLHVALGFDDGSFGVWRLFTDTKVLERRYRHEKSSNGELMTMAFSYPYLLTATEAVLVSLYTFEVPSAAGEGPRGTTSTSSEGAAKLTSPYLLTSLDSHTSRPPLALSIRKAGRATVASVAYTFSTRRGWSIGLQDLHIHQPATDTKSVPEITTTRIAYTTPVEMVGVSHSPPTPPATPQRGQTHRHTEPGSSTTPSPAEPGTAEPGPITLCYTHPYLLATLPDNTLVLHMCTSNASSLSISDGIRLWGHTSGISDAEITARGKAVSVSTRGEEMRVWELEGRSAGVGSRSVEIRPWQAPGSGSLAGDDSLHLGDPARDWDERRNWVGFDDEMVIVLKERKGARESLMVYDFT
ncbi:F-box only protein 15 [Parachaetomium inaequale]|uniref:F-box only protein 15 n=1 Tax=Parachaetomium inaequale TaxID=2588326 RepID=A0AAN6PGU0_9PEZI|nr:F-box only protein 15 [Parachaetomium inaequale]